MVLQWVICLYLLRMALIVEKEEFQGLLRIQNTNINGNDKVMYAIARVRGVGRRFANLIIKKAEIDLNKRAGELTEEELEKIRLVMAEPTKYDIPVWFLNRRKDRRFGKDVHLTSNQLDAKLRDDLERMKKIRLHRGIRHAWGLRVRGQHTCTTGRRGRVLAGGKAK
jgi:small subunit ribosomal protein S18e